MELTLEEIRQAQLNERQLIGSLDFIVEGLELVQDEQALTVYSYIKDGVEYGKLHCKLYVNSGKADIRWRPGADYRLYCPRKVLEYDPRAGMDQQEFVDFVRELDSKLPQ